jgi:hypothetical protein
MTISTSPAVTFQSVVQVLAAAQSFELIYLIAGLLWGALVKVDPLLTAPPISIIESLVRPGRPGVRAGRMGV